MGIDRKDPFYIQYKNIHEINQRLKQESSLYIILPIDGSIYIESLIPFIHKFGYINKNCQLDKYMNYGYLPNKFFEFTKNAKRTKLIYRETKDHLYLGQDDNNEIELCLDKIIKNDISKGEVRLAYERIVDEIYKDKRMLIEYTMDENEKMKFMYLSEDQIADIIKSKVIELEILNSKIIFTKQLFPSLKKTDKLGYAILPQTDEQNPNKIYVVFKEENNLYTLFTLCAFNLF